MLERRQRTSTMAENGKQGLVDWELYKQIRASMPLASVDILVVHEGRLLLMRRLNEPEKGVWFVPGGRIRYGELLEEAVLGELEEETGLTPVDFKAKESRFHFWSNAPTSPRSTGSMSPEMRSAWMTSTTSTWGSPSSPVTSIPW